jgi:hypothetical protein
MDAIDFAIDAKYSPSFVSSQTNPASCKRFFMSKHTMAKTSCKKLFVRTQTAVGMYDATYCCVYCEYNCVYRGKINK